jgi:hypothetical protein
VFGDYDLAKYAKPGSTDEDIKWFKNAFGSSVWQIRIKKVSFVGETSLRNFITNKIYLVPDSGTTYAVIPK